MAGATTIYLVRHAQSRPAATLREPDWPLSAVGRRQAERLARLLEPLSIDHVVSSPYVRCVETIRPFAVRRGLEIAFEDGLRERRITTELRRDFDEILARSWSDFDFALPGCESSARAKERIRPAVERIVERCSGKTVAVCSHGNVISLLLNALDSAFDLTAMMRLRNPDVLKLTVGDDGMRHDSSFDLEGLADLATPHADTPIEWSDRSGL